VSAVLDPLCNFFIFYFEKTFVFAILQAVTGNAEADLYSVYSGEEHQKACWKSHKKLCNVQIKLTEYNLPFVIRMRENSLKPEFTMFDRVKGKRRPRPTHCTGCDGKLGKNELIGTAMDECPECGYVACESCVCHTTRGEAFVCLIGG
jgi:hypothetical protein